MDDDEEECPFCILNLPSSASEEEVVKRWKRLLLQYHPDKSTDPHASDISKRLNDAKQRAVAICVQRKQDEQHQKEVAEHIARIRHMVRVQFICPISQYKELNQQMKQLIADCKKEIKHPLNPRPILGAYWTLVWTLDVKIQRLEKEAKALQTAIEELKNKYPATDESAVKTLHAQLDAERLAKERSIAEAHKANAAAEQARTELTAAKAQWDTEREAMQAQIKVYQKQLDTTELRNTKRKHIKSFASVEELNQFQTLVSNFVQTRLAPATDPSNFITANTIKNAFKLQNNFIGEEMSDTAFFKELKRQIDQCGFPPTVKHKQVCKAMGYKGLSLN